MSRFNPRGSGQNQGFPRVSGDEPWYQYHLIRYQTFSPRERG